MNSNQGSIQLLQSKEKTGHIKKLAICKNLHFFPYPLENW